MRERIWGLDLPLKEILLDYEVNRAVVLATDLGFGFSRPLVPFGLTTDLAIVVRADSTSGLVNASNGDEHSDK